MNTTPLHAWHVSHGAKMAEFAGWDMPIYYGAIQEEHRAVRSAAGLFDVSHMGRLVIQGPQAADLLDLVFTNDVRTLKPGRARYGIVCNPQGGAIDDMIVYRAEDHYLAVPNASNRDAVVQWLHKVNDARGFGARIEDVSNSLAMIAFQGPLAVEIAEEATGTPLREIGRFAYRPVAMGDALLMVARTGYTGEDGFEIILPATRVTEVWDALYQRGVDRGVRPAGLGARDSLRIEACLPLYGHEIGPDMNPIHAGLERFVKLEKEEFIGLEALRAAADDKKARRLAAFQLLERAVPRQGFAVERNGNEIGVVTSGLFSPTLGNGVGMAYIDPEFAGQGTEIGVRVRHKVFPARIASRPLYQR